MKNKNEWNLGAEQLSPLGILDDRTKLHPNRFFCNVTQLYMKIYPNSLYKDVMADIYNAAYERGVEEGKIRKAREFRNLLEIPTEDDY